MNKSTSDDNRAAAGKTYPLLAQPIRLAGLEIPNRTVMAAMSSVLGAEDGSVTPEILAYYKARAEGGTGLIVVEFTGVDRRFGRAELQQMLLDDDVFIPGHSAIVDAIRAAGGRACIQLHAPGQHADRRTVDGLPSGPSVVFSRRDGVTPLCRALEGHEILALIDSFRAAAERAVRAGYEAIELHGAHGYLPMAFLSPLKNQREDEWGGDERRRLRFAQEVVRAIKSAIGPNRPLIYRLSSTDFADGGLSIEDMQRIAPQLVLAGADAIHVSSGSIDGTLDRAVDPMSMPEGWRFAHARAIKDCVDVPVISVGPVRWPETAEMALRNGDVDMVALGRPLLADPAWTKKAIAGDAATIRPCTNCNWCFERVTQHKSIGCAENPRAGRETIASDLSGGKGRQAVVIGAGPGGMAAALDLEEAGFQVDLYEARGVVGGGLIASASPPYKEKIFWYLNHLKNRLANSGVRLHLGVKPSADQIIALEPAAVVLATGATALTFDIAGIDRENVLSAYDLLMGDCDEPPMSDLPVVVYGGGETGCETAEFLADRNHLVVLVTRSPAKALARSAEGMYRKHLLERLRANSRVTILENCSVVRVDDSFVRIRSADGERDIQAWGLVLAQGRESGLALADQLAAVGMRPVMIGDVKTIGRIGDAVHDARRAVLDLIADDLRGTVTEGVVS